jgi:hypothetical protein
VPLAAPRPCPNLPLHPPLHTHSGTDLSTMRLRLMACSEVASMHSRIPTAHPSTHASASAFRAAAEAGAAAPCVAGALLLCEDVARWERAAVGRHQVLGGAADA